jgi:hypothetical protein
VAVKFNITFTGETDVTPLISGEKRQSMLNLAALCRSMASGTDAGGDWTVNCRNTAVAAAGVITFAGLPVADETVTLCNVAFTAKASASTAAEFTIGASANATAVNLAAKINAHTTVSKYVSAAVTDTGVITCTALVPGVAGNAFALSEAATNTTVTAFTGGSEATSFDLSF